MQYVPCTVHHVGAPHIPPQIERYITHSGQVALKWLLLHIPLKLGERTPLGGPRHTATLHISQFSRFEENEKGPTTNTVLSLSCFIHKLGMHKISSNSVSIFAILLAPTGALYVMVSYCIRCIISSKAPTF